MSGYTNKQLAKVQRMAEIFERFATTPIPVRDFCMKEGTPTSTFSYWRGRFAQEGLKGRVDKRQGTSYKATEEIKRYIRAVKIKDSTKSASDISVLIEQRFHKSLSDRHIRTILEEQGLNDPPGRKAGKHKTKKRVIKNVVAGVGFILGAMSAMNGEETTLHVITRMKDRHPDGTRIHAHKTSTLLRYLRTLFFLHWHGKANRT